MPSSLPWHDYYSQSEPQMDSTANASKLNFQKSGNELIEVVAAAGAEHGSGRSGLQDLIQDALQL